jgi:hypothetical protein
MDIITKDFFKFRRLYELKRNDIFKRNLKGAFWFVLKEPDDLTGHMLIQTKYGKIRTEQITNSDIEVLYFPNI